jgi:hypothetical protein
MKGGKGGRKRRSPGGGTPRRATDRGDAKKGGVKRLATGAPKKGSRKKAFGPRSAAGDE